MIKQQEEKLTRKGRDVAPVALRTHARRAARGAGGRKAALPLAYGERGRRGLPRRPVTSPL